MLVNLNDFDFHERNFDLTTDPFFEALNLSEYNTKRNMVKSQIFQFQLGLTNGTLLIQKKLSENNNKSFLCQSLKKQTADLRKKSNKNILNKAHPNFLIRKKYIMKLFFMLCHSI